MHLAQINIARARYPLDDPGIAEFVNNLDRINAIAEKSPGFIWRLKDEESGNATAINPFDDPMMIVNMSVWESAEALWNFTYKSGHVDIMRKRKEWFAPMEGPHLAMWWIPSGHLPTAAEAKAKLEQLAREGPGTEVFTFRELMNKG